MFCPQCGHQQVSNDIRFCSRCGLSLSLATDLLPVSGDQLRREKRELVGVALMMATVLMLANFLLVFGLITLPHLANPVFLWLWISFMVSSFAVGGAGVTSLVRGGFFKRLKEREARLQLMKSAQDDRILADETTTGSIDSGGTSPRFIEPASVTETTTRELAPTPRDTR